MTIASLLVDVAANTVKLTKDVDKINSTLDTITGTAKKVAGALAATFTVAAVGSMVNDLLEFSGHLTDLSAKTGINTTGLQKLNLAFEQSGVSLDTVAAATLKLSKNLIDGDKSTVSILKKLGLSLEDLKRQSPEQQFLNVADAVGRIQNPAEKAYASMKLFDKVGTELLPSLNGHLTETVAQFEAMGLIIDEQTVKAADDFGDQLGLMGKQLMAIVATVVGPLLPALTAIGNILLWVGQHVIGPVFNVAIKSAMTILGLFWEGLSAILAKLLSFGEDLPLVGDKFAAMSKTLADSSKNTSAYIKGLWTEAEKVGTTAKAVTPPTLGLGKALDDAAEAAKKTAKQLAEIVDEMAQGIIAADQLAAAYLKAASQRDYNNYLAELAMYAEAADMRVAALAVTLSKLQATALEEPDFGSWFMGPFEWQRGPDPAPLRTWRDTLHEVAGAMSIVGDRWASVAVGMIRNLETVVALWQNGFKAQAIGQAIGALGQLIPESDRASVSAAKMATQFAAVGSVFGPWGTAIGAGVGALVGWIKVGRDMKKANDLRDAFMDAHGGLDKLHKSLVDQLGPTGDLIAKQLLAAKTTKEWEAATKALDAAMQKHEQQLKDAEAMVRQLGTNFNQIATGFIPKTKEQLELLGVVALSSINAMLQAGFSLAEALAMNHDGLQVLVQSYKDLGLSVDDPLLKQFLLQDAILSQNPALIQAISALGSSFEILAKFGMLNAETFTKMEELGMQMYTRLQDQVAAVGGTTKDALLPMQDFLHQAEQRAKELGIPLDDNLQMLIDQSKEMGIWQEKGKTATEKLLDGLNKLVERMDAFLNAIDRIPREINVRGNVEWTIPEPPGPPAPDSPAPPDSMAAVASFGRPRLVIGNRPSRAGAITTVININGGEYDTPAGQDRLVKRVSDAVINQQMRQRRLNTYARR